MRDLLLSLRGVLERNANLITGFLVVSVLVTGVAVVDSLSNWWLPLLLLSGLFVLAMLSLNLKVAVKFSLSLVVSLGLASFGYWLGHSVGDFGLTSLAWLFTILSTFFSLTTYSYVFASPRSRWGVLTFSQLLGFIVSVGVLSVELSPLLGVFLGSGVSVFIFVLLYSVFNRTRFDASIAPTSAFDAVSARVPDGWFCKPFESSGFSSYLCWSDRAYLVYPIRLDAPFAAGGRDGSLHYRGASLLPWLNSLIYRHIPTWRARNADITLVLYDVGRKSGDDVKVIGVSVPDSKRVIPVLTISSSGDFSEDLLKVDEFFGAEKDVLSPRQLRALSRIGVFGDDSSN